MSDKKVTKIAILGGNPETGALVDVAKSQGLYTVVLDPFSNSPAKRNADISYNVDVTDIDAVGRIIESEGISAVLVGVADLQY